MLTGRIEFYDDDCAWGLVRSDAGRLYDLRGLRLDGRAPRVGDRVAFEAQDAPGAPRAVNVRRLGGPAARPPAPRPGGPPHSPAGRRPG